MWIIVRNIDAIRNRGEDITSKNAYLGPRCGAAGVPGAQLYRDENDAKRDRVKLSMVDKSATYDVVKVGKTRVQKG